MRIITNLFVASFLCTVVLGWQESCIYNATSPFGNREMGVAYSDWSYLQLKEDPYYNIRLTYIEACADPSFY